MDPRSWLEPKLLSISQTTLHICLNGKTAIAVVEGAPTTRDTRNPILLGSTRRPATITLWLGNALWKVKAVFVFYTSKTVSKLPKPIHLALTSC
jgi:hypothetical protein